jgi:hypothetical protein
LEEVGIAMIQATIYGYTKQILENKDIAQVAGTNSSNLK